ncbi:MAG TPA: nucleotide exchange factor GrpE [Candidatus Sumerlaeota bacterium]|mgnify:CR=1 FL=1|nr:MAG: heat shock protein GrpE [candidate division BRC1 bacterium ADurb.BinA292]HOE97380.1 nucleotide exchange factor GrpE [Candidatus Sumerlaeota bacterium]HOR26746.1 nucleotide exchange factor GrpE [Candidatus Sumerlaeota bacterium]HPK01349.1 nucleotide exchange factor GrpE [Candidatus Sumerlaeota bacterium]
MGERIYGVDHRLARRLRRRVYRATEAETAAAAHLCDEHGHSHHHGHGDHGGHRHHGPGAVIEENEQLERLKDQLLRAQAEFENYRKRVRRDQEQQIAQAQMKLIEQLLPVLDNFERALANPGESVEALLQGLQMVQKQMSQVLEQNGLEKVPAMGQPFDPNLHEAVATDPADAEHPENTVTEVFQDGYRMGNRLLRPAMVKVAR